MTRVREGIGDRDAAPCESILKILGQKQPAAGVGRGGENQGIPDREVVMDGEIRGPEHDVRRRFDEGIRIAPAEERVVGVFR
jgi:hypothetical protein